MENLEPLKLRLEEKKNKSGSTRTKKMDAGSSSENPNPDWEYSSEWDEETRTRLAREFPQVADLTYLDHAASTLYSASQVEAVSRELTSTLIGNPHSGGRSSEKVSEARSSILAFLGASSDEYTLVFTAGATASLRLVGECWSWKEKKENDINTPTSSSDQSSIKREGQSRGLILHSESHTSAVGLRELAREAGAPVQVRDDQSIVELLEEGTNLSGWILCYPAMSNFNGRKLPLSWVNRAQSLGASVLLDTAALLSTCPLDLNKVQPDFLVLSFYKIFGLPTGLGALIVRRTVADKMTKNYFGGGTVDMHLVHKHTHVSRADLASRLEDGTGHFLGIASLRHGLRTIKALPGGMEAVARHTFGLAKLTFHSLSALRHHNKKPVVRIHCEDGYSDVSTQGGMVNFTLLDANGEVVGHSTFARIAGVEGIHVRTGCFCNTGGCQRWLGIEDQDTLALHKAGHVCGDGVDLVEGRPTGSVRVSFGYMSTRKDVDTLINLVKMHFVETKPSSDTEENQKPVEAKADQAQRTETGGRVVLESIVVYPVKSCRGIRVAEWPLGEAGLRWDRQWAVMQNGRVLTQKREPLLAQIQTKIDLTRGVLTLACQGEGEVNVPLVAQDEGATCSGSVCGERVEGRSCGDESSEWLERVLGIPGVHLVRGVSRRSNRATRSSSLANDSDCLLVGLNSLRALASKVEETCAKHGEQFADHFGSEPTWWLTVEKLLEKNHGLSFKLVQLSSKWEALAKDVK